MQFGLLLLPGIPSTVISGLLEFFELARHAPGSEQVGLKTVSLQSGPIRLNAGLSIEADVIGRISQPLDLLLIPAIGMKTTRLRERFGMEVELLRELSLKGTRLASICSGAFLLGETGLLSGKAATTHWRLASKFRRRFKDVDLQIDRMVVDAGSVLTSGGSNAFYDLALYLIEQYIGYEAAQFCSHNLLVDARRSSQSPFMPAIAQRQHSDSLVLAVQSSIERSFREEISPDVLAAHVGLSSRSLFRRFKSATGETPNTYQQRLRVDAAKRRLSEADDSIEEISFSVGYESVSFFRQVFKKHTGFNPLEYRRRFGRRLQSS